MCSTLLSLIQHYKVFCTNTVPTPKHSGWLLYLFTASHHLTQLQRILHKPTTYTAFHSIRGGETLASYLVWYRVHCGCSHSVFWCVVLKPFPSPHTHHLCFRLCHCEQSLCSQFTSIDSTGLHHTNSLTWADSNQMLDSVFLSLSTIVCLLHASVGTWMGGLLYWWPWRICKRAFLSIGAPLGNLEVGSYTKDFKR